jgi:hypothetical protein
MALVSSSSLPSSVAAGKKNVLSIPLAVPFKSENAFVQSNMTVDMVVATEGKALHGQRVAWAT